MIDRRTLIAGSAAFLGTRIAAAAPDDDAELCYRPVSDLIALFRARKLSPVELLQAQVRRIERYNPAVNAITYRHFEQALAEARISEARYRDGTARSLEGITVALKDEDDRVGWRTTMGSLILKEAPPATENAAIVDFLEAAGAVLHIQTTVPEFYLSASAATRAWGTTRNPWNLRYSPGGSSSGSAAALAAGFTTLATGSDMGGSIRIPSSQCGLYGFKAPFGRVATSEVSYETVGPLARRFDDLVHLQNAIVGPSPKVLSSLRPRLDYPQHYDTIAGWRLAIDWGRGIGDLLPGVRQLIEDRLAWLRGLGCIVDEVDCGFAQAQVKTMMEGLMSTSMGSLLVLAKQSPDLLTPSVRNLVENAWGTFGPVQMQAADDLATKLHRQVQERVFGRGYQVLLMPTVGSPFIPAEPPDPAGGNPLAAAGLGSIMTWPWNLLSRYPVIDVPLGLVDKAMPSGLQVVGNTFDDLAAFRFAAAWAATPPVLYAGAMFPAFEARP